MLTSREQASLIWLAALAVGLMVMAVRDRSLGKSLVDVIVMGVRPPISTTILASYGYMAGWVWLAAQVDAWNDSLLPATITWGVVSGFAMIFSATNADDDPSYFRKAIRNTFAATLLIELVFGLASFSLAVELIIQPILALLLMMEIMAKQDNKSAHVASCLGTLLALLGFGFLVGTLATIWRTRDSIDWGQQGLTLGMLIWLPLVSLPFVYLLSWGMNYGRFIRMIRWSQDERPVRMTTRAAVILGFNTGLHHLGRAHYRLARQLADARSLTESCAIIHDFRRSLPEVVKAGDSDMPVA